MLLHRYQSRWLWDLLRNLPSWKRGRRSSFVIKVTDMSKFMCVFLPICPYFNPLVLFSNIWIPCSCSFHWFFESSVSCIYHCLLWICRITGGNLRVLTTESVGGLRVNIWCPILVMGQQEIQDTCCPPDLSKSWFTTLRYRFDFSLVIIC